jgi:hypothetical protein
LGRTALKRLTGTLHLDGAGCTLSDAPEIKIGIPTINEKTLTKKEEKQR